MVETQLEKGRPDLLRVVVSSPDAAADVAACLESAGARVEIDTVGTDIHVIARFSGA